MTVLSQPGAPAFLRSVQQATDRWLQLAAGMPRIQGGEAGEPVPQPRFPQLRQDRAHMLGGQGGEERVRKYRDGIEDWVAAGLPTESA